MAVRKRFMLIFTVWFIIVAGLIYENLLNGHIYLHRKYWAFPGRQENSLTISTTTTANILLSHANCVEQTNVAFVKVHKAGSTTVMNILQRFAETRQLFIAFPVTGSHVFQYNKLVPIPEGISYNIFLNHVKQYNRNQLAKVMNRSTKYIGIVREPMEQVVSAFEYYRRRPGGRIYARVPGEDKLMEYFKNRQKYEPKNPEDSYTNNRMSFDFGLSPNHFHNTAAIERFIATLDLEMDLVLIVERFSESLVLLKRRFCWSLKDILYVARNANSQKSRIAFTDTELQRNRAFSLPDFMLYEHFIARFNEIVEAEGPNFSQEVAVFNGLLTLVKEYCENLKSSGWAKDKQRHLVFNRTTFSEPFVVTVDDCQMMLLKEIQFIHRTRDKQMKYVKTMSPANSWTSKLGI